jgi:glycerophosphoryl diester phosphodiesterase
LEKLKPKLIAHRGASNEAPENTLAAIRQAIDIGVDYIEFDVRLTQDGVPVIIHDPTLSRTTAGVNNHYVHELRLDQIQSLDIGSWFDDRFNKEKVPTLEEVLQVTSQTHLMIEIKEGIESPQIVVESLLKVLKSSECNTDLLTFGSFSIPIIQELIERAPSLKMIGIIEEGHQIEPFLNIGIKHIALWYPLITPDLIKQLHSQNVRIWTFTVDDPEIARSLISLSVDGIISNQPRSMKNYIL